MNAKAVFGKFPVKGKEICIRVKAGTSDLIPAEYAEKIFKFALEYVLSNVDHESCTDSVYKVVMIFMGKMSLFLGVDECI